MNYRLWESISHVAVREILLGHIYLLYTSYTHDRLHKHKTAQWKERFLAMRSKKEQGHTKPKYGRTLIQYPAILHSHPSNNIYTYKVYNKLLF